MSAISLLVVLVLALALASPARAELVEQYTYPLKDELGKNTSFEDGTTGFSCHEGYSIDETPTLAKDGAKTLKLEYVAGVHTLTPSCAQALDLPVGEYTISGCIKTEGVTKPRTGARIALRSDPLGGNLVASPAQSGTKDWTCYSFDRVAVTRAGTHHLTAGVFGIPSGKIWYDALSIRPHSTPDVEMYLTRPNFMGKLLPDAPSTIRVKVKAGNPAMTSGTIVATKPDGTVHASKPVTLGAEWTEHELPAEGANDLRVKLEVPGANFAPAYDVKRESAFPPGGYIDQHNVLHLPAANGKLTPRFAIGLYHTSGYDHKWGERLGRFFPRLKADLYLNYWLGQAPFEYLVSLGKYLRTQGMAYIDTINRANLATEARAKALAGRPGILGWYVMDEDKLHLADSRWAYRKRIVPVAPNMPFYVVSNVPRELYGWRDIGDVVATDSYPVRTVNRNPDGSYKLHEVSSWAKAAMDSTHGARPAWTVIQFFAMDSKAGWPTTQDVEDMSWLAICRGSRGLFYWSLGAKGLGYVKDSAKYEERLGGLANIITEIKSHESVLTAPAVPLPEPLPPGVAGVAYKRGDTTTVYSCNETNAEVVSADGTKTWRAYGRQIWTVGTPGPNPTRKPTATP